MKPAEKCVQCAVAYDQATDAPFLVLNPEQVELAGEEVPRVQGGGDSFAFCSSECLVAFVRQAQASSLLQWLAPSQQLLESRAARHGHLCLACAEPHRLGGFAGHLLECFQALKVMPRPVAEAKPFFAVEAWAWGGAQPFCSVACLERQAKSHPFVAKGYWPRQGLSCGGCGCFRRVDLGRGGCGFLEINSDRVSSATPLASVLPGHASQEQRIIFCRPQCVVDKIDRGELALVWVKSADTYFSDRQVCDLCEQRSEQFVAVDAPYGSKWDSYAAPSYFCSQACLRRAFVEDYPAQSWFV